MRGHSTRRVAAGRLLHARAILCHGEDERKAPHVIGRAIASVGCDEMSDGGWGAGDVKLSKAFLNGAITDRNVLVLS